LRASRTLPGFDVVRLPGDKRRRRAVRVANGVPMLGELIVQLDRLAAELGLKPVRER
jgi:L-2-hydroxycarboxylate dehydrogenase (NAD+)